MRKIAIFQTLENRGNINAVKQHGPYKCEFFDENGIKKTGIKEPWLGEGYYFWDSVEEDARWWGSVIYNGSFYVLKTYYDRHSQSLYDLVGDIGLLHEFHEIAKLILKERNLTRISFLAVLEYLRNHTSFDYTAIRVWPIAGEKKSCVYFPHKNGAIPSVFLPIVQKVQICFFDKTLLTECYEVVEITQEPQCNNSSYNNYSKMLVMPTGKQSKDKETI